MGEYVLDHLATESVLLRSGARRIPITGRVAHVPRVLTDGDVAWVAEGQQIPSSARRATTWSLTPRKVANVVSVTSEAIADANADTLDAVGNVRAAAGVGNVDLYTCTRHYFAWYAWNVLRLEPEVIADHFGHQDGGELVRRLYGHFDAALSRERVQRVRCDADGADPAARPPRQLDTARDTTVRQARRRAERRLSPRLT
jgi:hypothetical protein